MKTVVVTGSFNNIQSRDIRFLEEAAKIGPLTVQLWSDDAYQSSTTLALYSAVKLRLAGIVNLVSEHRFYP